RSWQVAHARRRAAPTQRICDPDPAGGMGWTDSGSGRTGPRLWNPPVDAAQLAAARRGDRLAQGRAQTCVSARAIRRRPPGRRTRPDYRDRAKPPVGLVLAGSAQPVARRQAADRFAQAGSGEGGRRSGQDGLRISVSLDQAILGELTVRLHLSGYLRILPRIHMSTPLGMGHGASRFSSPHGSFSLIYAARDLPTALA